MLPNAGVIVRETNTAGVTFSVADPDTVPDVAVIAVAPTDRLLASP